MPYMADGGIVVLHDVIDAHQNILDTEIATSHLFSTVHTKKWYMAEPGMELFDFSNIAAFEVNQECRESATDIMFGLSVPWAYTFSREESQAYASKIRENYSNSLAKMMDDIFGLQSRYQEKKREKEASSISQKKINVCFRDYIGTIDNSSLGIVSCRDYIWQTPFCPQWEYMIRITAVSDENIQLRCYGVNYNSEISDESISNMSIGLIKEASIDLYISGHKNT